MANPTHYEILAQGVNVWNQWRREHPDEVPDLSYTSFSHSNQWFDVIWNEEVRKLSNEIPGFIHFLSKPNQPNIIDLAGADFSHVLLSGTSLSEMDLSKTDLSHAIMVDTDLSKANLSHADLSSAVLSEANLSDTNLSYANLSYADLFEADLSEANLFHAILVGAKLVLTNLSKANITGTWLYGTSRDEWRIDAIKCDYVYWDNLKEERTPNDRNFRSGEFEELYKQLPTFDYVFEHGFTPIDAVVMARVVEVINEQHPELELDLVTFDKRGEPHATFTVLHQDLIEAAKAQVATIYERRIIELEAQKDQLMDVIKMLGSGGVRLQPVTNGITIKYVLSPVLTQRVVEFLGTLPGLEKEDARRAWLYSAGLDLPLQQQIQINGSSIQFFQLLVQTVVGYGRLNDGRLAIEAILNAAKCMVGQDRQAYCTTFIQEIHDAFNERI